MVILRETWNNYLKLIYFPKWNFIFSTKEKQVWKVMISFLSTHWGTRRPKGQTGYVNLNHKIKQIPVGEKIENTVSGYFRVLGKMKRRENEKRFYLLIFCFVLSRFSLNNSWMYKKQIVKEISNFYGIILWVKNNLLLLSPIPG